MFHLIYALAFKNRNLSGLLVILTGFTDSIVVRKVIYCRQSCKQAYCMTLVLHFYSRYYTVPFRDQCQYPIKILQHFLATLHLIRVILGQSCLFLTENVLDFNWMVGQCIARYLHKQMDDFLFTLLCLLLIHRLAFEI